ncbi:nose resistant to fluoxetine protein 6-like [Adelges cooleyi]|uniref:nose resistant to fluoxetine protein 6-like n=1 Tax=Adelges cooleyi TaxID=133065 RepID=UPI00217F83CF|nr:nose resistant to fluoxetine protein 6-like [Adelges cooleyi]
MYLNHLKNNSRWAVKMSDSWPRYLNGLLAGSTYHMGVYDECVSVHHPIQGKYCTAYLYLRTASNQSFANYNKNAYGSTENAWQESLGFINYDDMFRRNEVKLGVCIPKACTHTDLEVALQKELVRVFSSHQLKIQVEVQPSLCTTDEDLFPFEIGYYTTAIFIGLLTLTASLSTAYHLIFLIRNADAKKPLHVSEMIIMFSVIKNGRDLIKYDRNNNLNIYNGMKVITMVLVLFGHKFIFFIINPILNPAFLEETYTVGPFFLLTCMNLVDPFFYITGYLTYALLIPQFSKTGTNWFQVPLIIIYKYLRTLPIYIMMMLLTAFVIPHLGDGPFWSHNIWPEADKCKNYWWANILVISNFIEADNQCLIASWYISCLLQFVVIGTIIMYIYVKTPKIGTNIIVFLFCASLIIPFAMTYHYKAYGIVRVMITFLEKPSNSFEYRNLYRQIYIRGIPFYAGMLAGIMADALKRRQLKISTITTYFSTTIVIIICVYVQLYGKVFYHRQRPYNAMEQAIYATISHCTWTVMMFWITICHVISSYGPMEKLLNNRYFVPLGRLSYAVYLVNIPVMMMIESSQRAPIGITLGTMQNGWIAGVFKTYLAAITMYLLIEAPFGLLIKKLLLERKHNNARTNDKTNQRDLTSKTVHPGLNNTTKL